MIGVASVPLREYLLLLRINIDLFFPSLYLSLSLSLSLTLFGFPKTRIPNHYREVGNGRVENKRWLTKVYYCLCNGETGKRERYMPRNYLAETLNPHYQ